MKNTAGEGRMRKTFVLSAAAMFIAAAAPADKITLKDGRVLQGIVRSKSGGSVVLDVFKDPNFVPTKLPASDVVSIRKDALANDLMEQIHRLAVRKETTGAKEKAGSHAARAPSVQGEEKALGERTGGPSRTGQKKNGVMVGMDTESVNALRGGPGEILTPSEGVETWIYRNGADGAGEGFLKVEFLEGVVVLVEEQESEPRIP